MANPTNPQRASRRADTTSVGSLSVSSAATRTSPPASPTTARSDGRPRRPGEGGDGVAGEDGLDAIGPAAAGLGETGLGTRLGKGLAGFKAPGAKPCASGQRDRFLAVPSTTSTPSCPDPLQSGRVF